jgi:hypothetical protein
MSHRRWFALAGLYCGLLMQPPAACGQAAGPGAEPQYRLELRVRKAAEHTLTADTRTVAVDVFAERGTGRLLYVPDTNTGLAVVDGSRRAAGQPSRPAKWFGRLVLKVRKRAEEEFGPGTRQVGVEVYRDPNAGNLVYVSETGHVAMTPQPPAPEAERGREARWLYRLPLRVRRIEEDADRLRPPLRCNVEVYRHESAGALIYLADNGALAVLGTSDAVFGPKAWPPRWSHGLDLKARKPGQEKFDRHTPAFGVEVYHDDNSRATVYLSEALSLAVVRSGKDLPKGGLPRAPEWNNCLGSGTWAAEVFQNPNNGHTLFVSSGGALAALPARSRAEPPGGRR